MWAFVQTEAAAGLLDGDGVGIGDGDGAATVAVGDGREMATGVLVAVALGSPGDGAIEPVGPPHPERIKRVARTTALMQSLT
ncbi:MAG TPA: hypothetical protein VNU19_18700 [Candidatus Acidoferrum sp.]|jgi:hypothetical protein|nr:hypothetical protein [Candidatus Acidoferrum sp.]